MIYQNYANGIYCVDANYIQKNVACIYIIKQKDSAVIIETGTNYSVPFVLKALAQLGLSAKNVAYVIPTHVHLDHAGGAGEFMQQCPNAKLVIHPRGERHMINPSKLIASTVSVYGQKRFDKLYGNLVPVEQSRIIVAEDKHIIDFNGRKLQFLHTQGHAKHHFCIWDETSKGIFTGDTMGLSYREFDNCNNQPLIFPATTPTQFDPVAMHQSIELLLKYQPSYLYLTHFARIDCTDFVIDQLKKSIDIFVDIALNFADDKNMLVQKINQYLIAQLKTTDSKKVPLIQKLLQSDIELDAQGLIYWQQNK